MRFVAALSAAVALVLLGGTQAQAAAQATVDAKTGKMLNAVHELLQENKLQEARAVLSEVNPEKLKPYPRALVYQTLGFLDANEGRYEQAADNLQKAIALEALVPQQQLNARFSLAQIYMVLDRWPEAVTELEAWFAATPTPNAISYYTLAMAYYQSDQREKAFEPAQKAVEMSDDPKESWLQLLLALRMEKKQYEESIPLLQTLIEKFPKKAYFTQLAAVYMELDKSEKSLAVQQLAYAQGLLDTERELTRLAQLYMYHGQPWRAAQVVQKGLDSGLMAKDGDGWRLLGNSLLSAREYDAAIDPLRRAADISGDGELWLRLAQVHLQREEYDRAREALDSAFRKGGLRDEGHALLLSGITAYQQKRLRDARTAFVRASNHEKSREVAEKWLQFVEKEELRQQAEAQQTQTG
jgi:tetratricopeptide (TPR) repeat protein